MTAPIEPTEHSIDRSLREHGLDVAVLFRFVTGAASEDERHAVERWMVGDRARVARVEMVGRLWNVSGEPGSGQSDIAAHWDRIAARVKADREVSTPIGMRRLGQRLSFPQRPDREAAGMADVGGVKKLFGSWPRAGLVPHRFRRTAGLGMALGAAILVTAIGMTWFVARNDRFHGGNISPSPVLMREMVTRRGERATLDLPDGTHVILAPESRLRLPAAYAVGTGLGSRDLELAGEAYFEVKHDTARPFRVHTTAGIAEDLGTAFVVTAYPETRAMQVVVASGEVALRRTAGTASSPARPSDAQPAADITPTSPLVVLEAGDLARMEASGASSIQRGVDIHRYFSWTSGRLAFTATPLRDILPMFMRWYDVDIRLDDPALAARPLTATFGRGSAHDAVQRLEYLLDARAEWQGRVVTFRGR